MRKCMCLTIFHTVCRILTLAQIKPMTKIFDERSVQSYSYNKKQLYGANLCEKDRFVDNHEKGRGGQFAPSFVLMRGQKARSLT
jgi:hypothetical protein